MLVKFWDLDTRHCFKTLVSHRSEVNDLILVNDEERLITGCHDNELRVFQLSFKAEQSQENGDSQTEPSLKKLKITNENNDDDDTEEDGLNSILDCKFIGSLIRESKDPLSQLNADKTNTVFSSHSANEKHIEIYKINTDDDIKKRLSKKLKKQKRKLGEDEAESDLVGIEKSVNDEFTRVAMLKTKHKIKFVDLIVEAGSSKKVEASEILFECKVACLLQNNQIEVYLVKVNKHLNKIEEPDLVYTINTPGHRTDVRTLCFNSDSTAFVSASGDSMKVWNRMSLNCIRTFACDYALSSLFLSDDNHVLVGTKSGKVQLFNINSASMLENVIAHDNEAAVWSMCFNPDKSGFVSGAADKTVKFWNFELIDDEENKTK